MNTLQCSASVVWSYNRRNKNIERSRALMERQSKDKGNEQSSREDSCEMEGGGGREPGQRDGREKETEAESEYVPCCPEIQNVVTGGSE